LHKRVKIVYAHPGSMLTSVNAMTTTYAKIVNDGNDRTAGGVVSELNRTSGDATLTIYAFTVNGFNDRS
jgi:hypothetical protein